MATDSENRHCDTGADDTSAFDELAARAVEATRTKNRRGSTSREIRRQNAPDRRRGTAFSGG